MKISTHLTNLLSGYPDAGKLGLRVQKNGGENSGPVRVMIVDDDPFVRDVAATALGARGGVDVMACDSGAAALVAFDAFSPGLLLLDLMMPGMDGRAVWRVISERAHRPRLIFLTGRDDPETRAEVKALGAEGLIAKPFDPGTFAETVLGLVEQARVRTTRLDALARDFAAGLPATCDAIERTWSQLTAWDAIAAEALLASVHRLAGVAPMFGFTAVGATADRAEELLRAALANDGWKTETERHAVGETVSGLVAALRA